MWPILVSGSRGSCMLIVCAHINYKARWYTPVMPVPPKYQSKVCICGIEPKPVYDIRLLLVLCFAWYGIAIIGAYYFIDFIFGPHYQIKYLLIHIPFILPLLLFVAQITIGSSWYSQAGHSSSCGIRRSVCDYGYFWPRANILPPGKSWSAYIMDKIWKAD